MATLQWLGEPMNEGGVTEHRFHLTHDTGRVPGILWTPIQTERPVPLVLLGHGGSGHKRADRQLMLARRLASVSQIAAVAIDGPFHGERAGDPHDQRPFQERMAAVGVDKVVDNMVEDWRATLDALSQLESINANRVAYIGFSMGTRFGLPYVAAAGDRLRCAVLGKNGMRLASPGVATMTQRFHRDAPAITIPVLFHVQWDDELFPRDGQFALFDMLGARDKQLIAFPGPHSAAAPAAVQAWCDFVTRHLAG